MTQIVLNPIHRERPHLSQAGGFQWQPIVNGQHLHKDDIIEDFDFHVRLACLEVTLVDPNLVADFAGLVLPLAQSRDAE